MTTGTDTVATADGVARRAPRPRVAPDEWRAFGFVGPLIVLEVVFVTIPLVLGVYYSFFRVDYFELTEFRGLENYARMITSLTIVAALVTTSVFTVGALVLTLTIGMALALHLERDNPSNVAIRTVALVPYVISMLVGSLLLRWLFSTDAGLVGMALGPFGMADATILADPTAAMGALIFNAVWRDSAFAMILLLAGLKSIPPELFQAARVDGAGAWMRFRRITVPLMRIPILITLVRLMIHFVNVLTFSLILTGGGPNNATQTLGLAMYRIGFVEFRLGEANALAFLVFLFNLVLITILLVLFRQRREERP